jgi:hypothetical protein
MAKQSNRESEQKDTGAFRRSVRIGMVASVDPQKAEAIMKKVADLLDGEDSVAKSRVYRIVPQTLQDIG